MNVSDAMKILACPDRRTSPPCGRIGKATPGFLGALVWLVPAALSPAAPPYEIEQTPPLSIADEEFEHGINLQAPGKIRVGLPRGTVRFEGAIGIDDWVNPAAYRLAQPQYYQPDRRRSLLRSVLAAQRRPAGTPARIGRDFFTIGARAQQRYKSAIPPHRNRMRSLPPLLIEIRVQLRTSCVQQFTGYPN